MSELSLYVASLSLCRISLSMSELLVCVTAIALTSRSIFSVYIRTSFELSLSRSILCISQIVEYKYAIGVKGQWLNQYNVKVIDFFTVCV